MLCIPLWNGYFKIRGTKEEPIPIGELFYCIMPYQQNEKSLHHYLCTTIIICVNVYIAFCIATMDDARYGVGNERFE